MKTVQNNAVYQLQQDQSQDSETMHMFKNETRTNKKCSLPITSSISGFLDNADAQN